jgi:hypothetical protein
VITSLIKGRNSRLALVFAVMALLSVLSTLVSAITDLGSNYRIYEYISTYRNIHGEYPVPGAQSPISGDYRDYTPVNSLIYRALFSASDSYKKFVFLSYELIILGLGLVITSRLAAKGLLSDLCFKAIILYFLLSPLVWRMMSGDDKTYLFTLPMLIVFVFETRNLPLSSVCVGLYAGWTGAGAAVLPLILGLNKASWNRRILWFGVAVVIFLACFAVDGRDGIDAIKYRQLREAHEPFWYSIWRILPFGDVRSVRAATTAIYVLIVGWLALKERMPRRVAIIVASSAYLLFSNNTDHTRLLFFIPTLVFCFQKTATQVIFLAISSALFLVIHKVGGVQAGDRIGILTVVLLCNAPLLWAIGAAIIRAIAASARGGSCNALS